MRESLRSSHTSALFCGASVESPHSSVQSFAVSALDSMRILITPLWMSLSHVSISMGSGLPSLSSRWTSLPSSVVSKKLNVESRRSMRTVGIGNGRIQLEINSRGLIFIVLLNTISSVVSETLPTSSVSFAGTDTSACATNFWMLGTQALSLRSPAGKLLMAKAPLRSVFSTLSIPCI